MNLHDALPRALFVWVALAASFSAAGAEPAIPPKVVMTLDLTANARFEADVRAALHLLQRRLDGRLCHPLTAEPLSSRPAFCAPESEPAIVHVVMLRDSAIWRLSTTHAANLELPAPIGSLAKAVVAVPLLAHAGANADETWCVLAVPGLRNADGFTGHMSCDLPGTRVSATQALARSNNLATIWRLRQLDPDRIRGELARAGVRVAPGDFHPGVAVALGMLNVSPRQALECLDAMAQGRARRAAITFHARGAATEMAQWCGDSTGTPEGRRFVDRLLQAPVQPGGTASFLPALVLDATHWLAKTGTPTDNASRDTAKLLLFALQRNALTYAMLISLAAPKPSWPLAERLSSADLVGIAKLGANEIAADGAP